MRLQAEQGRRGGSCVCTGGTHGWQGKEGDADEGEGGCDQTAFPRLGGLVSIANGGQCDLKGEGLRRGAPRERETRGVSLSSPITSASVLTWGGGAVTI